MEISIVSSEINIEWSGEQEARVGIDLAWNLRPIKPCSDSTSLVFPRIPEFRFMLKNSVFKEDFNTIPWCNGSDPENNV